MSTIPVVQLFKIDIQINRTEFYTIALSIHLYIYLNYILTMKEAIEFLPFWWVIIWTS